MYMMHSSKPVANDSVFNVSSCLDLITRAKQAGAKLAGQDVILLFGRTGAGKSSLIHWLCGSTFESQQIDGLLHIAPVTVKRPSLDKIKTSPHMRSETRYISAVGLPYSDLGIEREGSIFLCDTPGFEDTGGAEVDVANMVGVVEALKGARSIQVLLLFSREGVGSRFECLAEDCRLLTRLIQPLGRYLDTFSFVFTKHTSDELAEVHAKIQSKRNCLSVAELGDPALMSLFDAMLEDTKDEVLSFNPLNDKMAAKKFLKKILNRERITNPGDVFFFSASDKSRKALREQLDIQQHILRKNVLVDEIPAIKETIGQIVQIKESIPFDEVKIYCKKSLDLVEQRVESLFRQANAIASSIDAALLDQASMQSYVTLYQKLEAYQSLDLSCFSSQQLPSSRLVGNMITLILDLQLADIPQNVLCNLKHLSEALEPFQVVYEIQKKKISAEAERLAGLFEARSVTLVQIDSVSLQDFLSDIMKAESFLRESHSHLDDIFIRSTQEAMLKYLKYFFEGFCLQISEINILADRDPLIFLMINPLLVEKDLLLTLEFVDKKFIATAYETIDQAILSLFQKIDIVLQNLYRKPLVIQEGLVKRCIDHLNFLVSVAPYKERANRALRHLKNNLDKKLHELSDIFIRGIAVILPDTFFNADGFSWLPVLRELLFFKKLSCLGVSVPEVLTKLITKIDQYWLPLKSEPQRIFRDDEIKVISWVTSCLEHLSFIEDDVFLAYKNEYIDWLGAHLKFYENLFNKNFESGLIGSENYKMLNRCYQKYYIAVEKSTHEEAVSLFLSKDYPTIDALELYFKKISSKQVSISAEIHDQEEEKNFLLSKLADMRQVEKEYIAIIPINSKLYIPWHVSNFFMSKLHLKGDPWETALNFLKDRGYVSLNSLRRRCDEVFLAIQQIDNNCFQLQQAYDRFQEQKLALNDVRSKYITHVNKVIQERHEGLLKKLLIHSIPSEYGLKAELARLEHLGQLNWDLMQDCMASVAYYRIIPYFSKQIDSLADEARSFLSQYSKLIQGYLNKFFLNCFGCDKEILLFVTPLLIDCIKLAGLSSNENELLSDFFPKAYAEELMEAVAYQKLLFSDNFCKSKFSGLLIDCFDKLDRVRVISSLDVYLKRGIFHRLYFECYNSLYSYVVELQREARAAFKAAHYLGFKSIVDQLKPLKNDVFISAQLKELKVFLNSSINQSCACLHDDLILIRVPISSDFVRKILRELRNLKELAAVFDQDDMFSILDILQNTLRSAEENLNRLISKYLDMLEQHIEREDFRFFEECLFNIISLKLLARGILLLDSRDRVSELQGRVSDVLGNLKSFYLSSSLTAIAKKSLCNFYENIFPLLHDSRQVIYREVWYDIEKGVMQKFQEALNAVSILDEQEKEFFEAVLRSFPVGLRERLSIAFYERERMCSHTSEQKRFSF